jgi:hypothetical protein
MLKRLYLRAVMLIPFVAALAGCTAAQTAAVDGAEATALTGIHTLEDHNMSLWVADACGTPFSAIVRNAQTRPGLIPALGALCVPNGANGNPSTLLDKAATH